MGLMSPLLNHRQTKTKLNHHQTAPPPQSSATTIKPKPKLHLKKKPSNPTINPLKKKKSISEPLELRFKPIGATTSKPIQNKSPANSALTPIQTQPSRRSKPTINCFQPTTMPRSTHNPHAQINTETHKSIATPSESITNPSEP